MKKWQNELKRILILLCMIFLCSGCNKEREENENIQNQQNDDALWVAPMSSKTYGREGMFYTERNRIYFMDAATGESDIICDSVQCTHKKEECSAYFDGITYVSLNGDKLLVVTGEGADKAGDMFLCETDLNGTNRKEIAYLGNMQSIWQVMFTEEVIVISYLNRYDENMEPMDENIAGIYVYDLTSGKGEFLWQKQAYNAVTSNFAYYEDFIYFFIFYYDVTLEELLENGMQSDFVKERAKTELCSINRKDKSFSVIQEGIEEGFDICQNKVWFSYEDAVWYYDIDTGEKAIGLDRAMRIESSYGTDCVLMRGDEDYYTYYSYVPGGELIKNGTKDKVSASVIYPEITWAQNYNTPTGNGEVIYWDTEEFIGQGEPVSEEKEPLTPEAMPSVTITEKPSENETVEITEKPVEQVRDIQVITWVVPDMVSEKDVQEKADILNKKLQEDGYPMALQIKTVSWLGYREEVASLLESGEVDIISAGIDMADGSLGYGQDFVREDYFEELSDYLVSEKGQRLREWYSEQEWKSVETDGKIYTLPNQYSIKGSNFIAFNKEYITEEMLQEFHGTPGELYELLSSVDIPKGVYPIIGSYSVKSLAFLSGNLLDYGVLFDLETGEAGSPFDNKEFYNCIDAWNKIYDKGLVSTFNYVGGDAEKEKALEKNNFVVWLGSGFDTLYEEKQDEVIYVYLPFTMQSALSSTNGINKNSTKKDQAWELLTLLYTEECYANRLVFGEEGKDYQLINGFVSSLDDEERKNYWESLTFGIYDSLLPLEKDSLLAERRTVKDGYYVSEYCLESAVLGFQPDFTIFSDGIPQAINIVNRNDSIWQEADFEAAWAKAKAEFEASGGNELIEELNRQVSKWMDETKNK